MIKSIGKINRRVLFCSRTIKGRYRFKDIFQLLPVPSTWANTTLIGVGYPFILEFKEPSESFDLYVEKDKEFSQDLSPEWVLDASKTKDYVREIIVLLNVFARSVISSSGSNSKWIVPKRNNINTNFSTCRQIGYYVPSAAWDEACFDDDCFSVYPSSVVSVDAQSYYGNTIPTTSSFFIPEIIDNLLSVYFYEIDRSSRKAFRKAALLFDKASSIDSISRSISYGVLVSCIETLMHFEQNGSVERCKECGQERYKIVKRFKDFVEKYSGKGVMTKDHVGRIYKNRSHIVHRGELFEGELISYAHDWDGYLVGPEKLPLV